MKKLSKITEGILGDIAKRDLSGGRKKEDVEYINNLDMNEFMNFLNEIYEKIDSPEKPFYKTHTDEFCARLESPEGFNSPVLKIGFTSDFTRIEELRMVPFSTSEPIANMLIDKGFKIETSKDYIFFIKSKTNKVSNDLVIAVMDTIINNFDNLLIKRK